MARVALATEGRPAARKIAVNIADKHLVFISCVARIKKSTGCARHNTFANTRSFSLS